MVQGKPGASTGTRSPHSAVTPGSRLITSGSCRTSHWRGTTGGLPRNPRRETPARKTNPWVQAATAQVAAPELVHPVAARTPTRRACCGREEAAVSQQRSCHGRDPRVEEPSTAPGRGTKPRLCGRHCAGPSSAPSGRRGPSKQHAGMRPRSPTPLHWHRGHGSPASIAGSFLLCPEGPEQPGCRWCHVSLSRIPRTAVPADPSPAGVRSTAVPGCAPYALDLCTTSASGTVRAGCSARTLPLARPELPRPCTAWTRAPC